MSDTTITNAIDRQLDAQLREMYQDYADAAALYRQAAALFAGCSDPFAAQRVTACNDAAERCEAKVRGA